MNNTLIEKQDEIRFYRSNGPFGFLSNLYKCKIIMDKIEFKSSEFAYQYHKFRKDTEKEIKVLEWAMNSPTSSLIAQLSHSLFAWQIVPNWSKIKLDVMKKVLLLKFTQNPELGIKLLETGDKILIEDSKSDSFWGIGKKANGKNNLGKLLMEIRNYLSGN